MSLLTKAFSADVKVSDGERAVTAVISTNAVDRDGEVLIPQGCNWKEFNANPVVFLGHDYYTLPVGKVVALTRDDKSITAKIVFAARPAEHPAGQEWLPDTLLSLFQQGILKGFSVGFTTKESRPATDKDLATFGAGCRRVISKWTLMELSVAPLPCNQDAVAMAVSKGFMSPAMAKGVWGIEGKADVAVYDSKAAAEGIIEIAPPAKLVYFIDPPAPAKGLNADAIAAKAAAKARGALYYI